MPETTFNREYKDRLFKFIFGRVDRKEWTLSLYNAVNGSHYTDPQDIEITTVENAIYLSMKNDISFLIADTMNFYEHQSTYNPNMPLRMFIYASMVYSKYATEAESSIYSSTLMKLPYPKLVTFYNGERKKPERKVLRLSDAFECTEKDSDIEVKVLMLNINYGCNKELLERSRPLYDYSFFTSIVRKLKKKGCSMETAVHNAIRELGDDSQIKAFMLAEEETVTQLCITEYDEARENEKLWNEAMAKGLEKGLEKGLKKGLSEGRKMEAERMDRLVSELLKADRVDDLKKATSDSEFKNKLFREFNL